MRKDFKTGGPVIGNLPWVRGTSRPGVKKAPRGAQHKEAIKQEKRWKDLDTKIKGKVVPGPEKGKYPGIDKAMENMMENLEKGGKVSEESQGLKGARDMFATAQRLEGVM